MLFMASSILFSFPSEPGDVHVLARDLLKVPLLHIQHLNPGIGAELADNYADSFEPNSLFEIPVIDPKLAAVHAKAVAGTQNLSYSHPLS